MKIYSVPQEVKDLMKKAFPSYNGRKFEVVVADPETKFRMTSYWCGGSRDWWAIMRLEDGRVVHVPENGTPFVPEVFREGQEPKIVPGFAFIRQTIFQGEHLGLTMYVHPENMAPLLPKPEAVSWQERVVLYATRALKSTYAGERNYRFQEARRKTGITEDEWAQASESLKAKGMLNKAGAITDKGRDAISGLIGWPRRGG